MEKNSQDRDRAFVIRTLVIAIIIMAALKVFLAQLPSSGSIEQRVNAFAQTIIPVRAMDVGGHIEKSARAGKPVFLYVYASWCGQCAQMMPQVINLLQGEQLRGFEPVVLSIDRDFFKLSNYLVRNEYAGYFTPYLLKKSSVMPLDTVVGRIGGRYANAIPYVAVIDVTGRVVVESFGQKDWAELMRFVEELRKQ